MRDLCGALARDDDHSQWQAPGFISLHALDLGVFKFKIVSYFSLEKYCSNFKLVTVFAVLHPSNNSEIMALFRHCFASHSQAFPNTFQVMEVS
jgi:hypothetical protein